MFAWGKTPFPNPGKIPLGWNPRSKAPFPDADRSIWKFEAACATWASRLWFSSSTMSNSVFYFNLSFFLVLSWFCFKSVLKVKFSSQKYHLLWWQRSDENEERTRDGVRCHGARESEKKKSLNLSMTDILYWIEEGAYHGYTSHTLDRSLF